MCKKITVISGASEKQFSNEGAACMEAFFAVFNQLQQLASDKLPSPSSKYVNVIIHDADEDDPSRSTSKIISLAVLSTIYV